MSTDSERRALHRDIEAAEATILAIEDRMNATMGVDDDAYDAAERAFDAAYRVLLELESELLDIEDRDHRAEERSLSGWYLWASL